MRAEPPAGLWPACSPTVGPSSEIVGVQTLLPGARLQAKGAPQREPGVCPTGFWRPEPEQQPPRRGPPGVQGGGTLLTPVGGRSPKCT